MRAFRPVNYLDFARILHAMCQEIQVPAKKWRAWPPVNYLDVAGILQAVYWEILDACLGKNATAVIRPVGVFDK